VFGSRPSRGGAFLRVIKKVRKRGAPGPGGGGGGGLLHQKQTKYISQPIMQKKFVNFPINYTF